jgi:hypothetical protein
MMVPPRRQKEMQSMTEQEAQPAAPALIRRLLEAVRARAAEAKVFREVRLTDAALVCDALEADAEHRVEWREGRLWVSLVTPDRWLSQSIEADLVHTGDKLEDLIDEELVDLGCDAGPFPMEHFRSEEMLYTFRSPLPVSTEEAGQERGVAVATAALLAYEAAFRELGDMAGGDED